MDQKSNVMGTVSLACGIGLIVCFFIGTCMSFVPFLGMFAIIFFPIDWILALAGLVTGIVGFTTSRTMDGVGAPQSLIGGGICGAWILMQVLVLGLAFLMIGGMFVLSILGAVAGGGNY